MFFVRPAFYRKWKITNDEIKKVIAEEKYKKWDDMIGKHNTEISTSWKKWGSSIVGIGSPPFGTTTEIKGESRTFWFMNWENGLVFKKVTSI